MICNNCHKDAGNENFCPYCGAPLRQKYCPQCHRPLPPDGRTCYSCGWSEAAQYNMPGNGYAGGMPEPAPEVRSNDKGLISGRRGEDGNRFEYGAPRRTAVQTIFSLISGIAVLAVCGVTIYFMLMGNMFSYEGVAINPLTMAPADGSFGLVYNLEEIIRFFMNIAGNFTQDDLASMIPYISQILLITVYVLSAVILSVSTLIAVFAFIIGMARGRNFSMASFAAIDFACVGMIWFASRFGYFSALVDGGSGTFTCLVIAVIGLAACLLSNLAFAGARALKPGSLAKFVTNAVIFAGGFICFFFFPFRITAGYEGNSSEILSEAENIINSIIGTGEVVEISIYSLVCMIGLLTLTVKYIFSMPFFASKTASRLARTFKFDGYKDKGIMYRSILLLIGAVMFAVFGFVYIKSLNAEPSVEFITFCISAVTVFVFAMINRLCKDRDQL